MNLFDLALAITYEAHYQVEHADDDFVDEMMDAAEEGDFDADRDFLPEGGLNRRAWLDTGRDEVIRDDLLCEAAPTTTYAIQVLRSTDDWHTIGQARTSEEAQSCLESMKRTTYLDGPDRNTYRIKISST